MGERIEILHVMPVPYQGTASGLIVLAEKIREMGIPAEAIVEYRPWNVMEFVWSSYTDLNPEE